MIRKIDNKVIQKCCTIHLVTQQIEDLNVVLKNMLKLENLLNKNWFDLAIDKVERKDWQHGLALFIKATKTNLKRCINCFGKIERF